MAQAEDLAMKVPTPQTECLWRLSVSELRQIIAQEVATALQTGPGHTVQKDKLLTPDQAPKVSGKAFAGSIDMQIIPFTHRISRKNLRFSEVGLRRWPAGKKCAEVRNLRPSIRVRQELSHNCGEK